MLQGEKTSNKLMIDISHRIVLRTQSKIKFNLRLNNRRDASKMHLLHFTVTLTTN